MTTAIRVLNYMLHHLKATLIEQCPVFRAIKTRVVEWLSFIGADRLAVCGAAREHQGIGAQ